jgi:hypothetical protein
VAGDGGFENALTSHAGIAWVRTKWATVQRAAGEALDRLQAAEPAARACTLTDESPA